MNVQVPIFPHTSVAGLVDVCRVTLVVVATVVVVVLLVVRVAVSLAIHDAGSLAIPVVVVLIQWLFSSTSM